MNKSSVALILPCLVMSRSAKGFPKLGLLDPSATDEQLMTSYSTMHRAHLLLSKKAATKVVRARSDRDKDRSEETEDQALISAIPQ